MILYNYLLKFQFYHPNIYIGGSVSLILQNIIPFREIKDIDIISPIKLHIYDIFEVDKQKHPLRKTHKQDNYKFDLFINPKAQFIEYKYNDQILKLSPASEIFEWKYKFQKKNPNCIKNNKDIAQYELYLNNIT